MRYDPSGPRRNHRPAPERKMSTSQVHHTHNRSGSNTLAKVICDTCVSLVFWSNAYTYCRLHAYISANGKQSKQLDSAHTGKAAAERIELEWATV